MGAGHLWFHTPTQFHAGEQYPHNILYGARQAMIIVRSIKKKKKSNVALSTSASKQIQDERVSLFLV